MSTLTTAYPIETILESFDRVCRCWDRHGEERRQTDQRNTQPDPSSYRQLRRVPLGRKGRSSPTTVPGVPSKGGVCCFWKKPIFLVRQDPPPSTISERLPAWFRLRRYRPA